MRLDDAFTEIRPHVSKLRSNRVQDYQTITDSHLSLLLP